MKYCNLCGKERPNGRRLCSDCFKIAKRQYAKQRYQTRGRYMYHNICKACKAEFAAWRKSQSLCKQCHIAKLELNRQHKVTNKYIYNKRGRCVHRIFVEEVLGRKLSFNEVIHHLDGNVKNNDPSNLIVLSRSKHAKLHAFLSYQRVILEKSSNENGLNCWNNLRVPITNAWLETASVKVIKIWEIGQSAAKLP